MTVSYSASKGVSAFFCTPGEVDTINCKLCGTQCSVTRNVYGPTGFAESMSGSGHLHDSFRCPNVDTDWHNQATTLANELYKTHSPRLRALIIADIIDILRENGISDEQLKETFPSSHQ